MSYVVLQDIFKSYGSVKALKGLSLCIPKGCLYGLLGPNGAGKTTIIRILCTLLSQDSGKVLINGVNSLKNPTAIRRGLGYVAQDVAIDKILTGRELLQLQGSLYHLPKKFCENRIQDLIVLLEMSDWIDRRTGAYSGGMKRRLDLACGLLHQPQLLVLDEPTVGLDIESRSTIWTLLRNLRSEGITIILSSHYLEEINALADQIAIIDKGEVIAEGAPEELKRKIGGNRVILKVREFSNQAESEQVKKLINKIDGVSNVVINKSQGFSLNCFVNDERALLRIREQVSGSHFQIFSLSESSPSLDDVYLQVTGKTIMDAEIETLGKRDLKSEAKKSMR